MTIVNKPAVRVEARFDRSLIWRRGGSVRYLVADITCADVDPVAPRPLNLAFIIDASGSMAGERIDAAKDAAARLVDQLDDDDRLSIVAFDSEARVVAGSVKCDESGRRDLRERVRFIETGATTNLSGGWLLGAECVARHEEFDSAQNHVVLLSDGHANEGILDPTELAKHARELADRGVTSSAVGIGDDYSPVHLNAISDHGGGRTHDAERPHEIAEVVGGELGELRRTVLEDARLRISAPDALEIEVVSAFGFVETLSGVDVRVGSLSPGASRRVVLRVKCPAGTAGDSIGLTVGGTARSVEDHSVVTSSEVAGSLKFAAGRNNSGQPRRDDIAVLVAAEWQGHAIRHAVELNRRGDFERASAYLMAQLRHFKRYCADLPGGNQLVEDFELAARRMANPIEERSRKEVVMASRMTSRSEVDFRSLRRPDSREFLKR